MAKVICKGTKLKQTIAASLVDIAQVSSIEESGAESNTYASTTLDQVDAFETEDLTGYSKSGTISGELYYDPALAGHKAITSRIATPASNAMQLVFADQAATTKSFTVTGHKFGATVDMGDGLKGKFEFKISGNPGWPA